MEFEETKFMSYVDNIFIKILHAIMFKKLDTIDHFVSDDIYHKLEIKIEKLNNNNYIQMYEMTNVKESSIISKKVDESKTVIDVSLTSRFVEYIMEKDTNKIVEGDDNHRVERQYILTFEKLNNTKEQKISRKCPGCGANMDINNSGKCEYCGAIYDLENYDFVLTDYKKL